MLWLNKAQFPLVWMAVMSMPPSWVLFLLIVIGGAVAVVANTLYPLARAQEAKERLALDARAILRPEIKRNFERLASIDAALKAGNLTGEKLDVSAWETVSRGGLLVGLKPAEINDLLRAYNIIYEANELETRIVASLTGIESALGGASNIRQGYVARLVAILPELQKALSDLNSGMK